MPAAAEGLAPPLPPFEFDWAAPWLAPYRASGQAVQRGLGQGLSVAEALNQQLDRSAIQLAAGPLRFSAPDMAAPPTAYEAHIARTAQVPTRNNLHDFFNGLVWLAFPRLKRCLNELQAQQIALHGIGPSRGALRDRWTLFDENGALWQAPPSLINALQRRDWHALFVTHRGAWQDARTTLVGHALLEKLTSPRKAMTTHAWVVPEGVDAEAWIVDALAGDRPASHLHLPLPVLGIPGWWRANECEAFYADTAVFRPLRG